ncbi:MAG: hypothetical protein LBC18_10685 [Opitutaceae bacterium]|jgi:hypothetical protein|nr:hypothetical protein [Opitutaceae bacterium]
MNIKNNLTASRRRAALGALLLLAALAPPRMAAFDFGTAQTFGENFREAQSSNHKKLSWDKAGKSMKAPPPVSATYIYDTTPADASAATQNTFAVSQTDTLTVRVTFAAGTPRSSIGIYLIDPADERNGLLALYNVDNDGGDDVIRFVSNAMPATGGAGGVDKAEKYKSPGIAPDETGTLVLTYGIDAENKGVMTLRMLNGAGVEAHSASHTVKAFRNPLAPVAVGLRVSAQNGRGAWLLKSFEAAAGPAR